MYYHKLIFTFVILGCTVLVALSSPFGLQRREEVTMVQHSPSGYIIITAATLEVPRRGVGLVSH